ncbi:MAG: DUF2399 domain-containing protein [Chloroflexi bacterium]|nr:DUF2399 domain-containing protein [Chloroflexota bacterium]
MDPGLSFVPSPDIALLLHTLLDILERRPGPPLPPGPWPPERSGAGEGQEAALAPLRGVRAIRCALPDLPLPGYNSQLDPAPRATANQQLQALERAGVVRLTWLRGETGHLLESVTLLPERAADAFRLLSRTPLADHRSRLADLLLGERFRFHDWRVRALQHALAQLQAEKSPAPFSLTDEEFNRDLLTALAALDEISEETAYRVFSVRVFNDSKRLEALMRATVVLARRNCPEWRGLTAEEVLRELNLVPNPGHLYLHGPWQLVDDAGQILSPGEFQPSVGLPAAQAGRLLRATVAAPQVICVENPTSFYELIRNTPYEIASLCLWGNPSPACRHLLRCLPAETPLRVWADLDYCGLNILAQLREQVHPRVAPLWMDVATLEAHAQWARPLSPADQKNLTRLLRRPALADQGPLIRHLLQRGLKLEQEAIRMP